MYEQLTTLAYFVPIFLHLLEYARLLNFADDCPPDFHRRDCREVLLYGSMGDVVHGQMQGSMILDRVDARPDQCRNTFSEYKAALYRKMLAPKLSGRGQHYRRHPSVESHVQRTDRSVAYGRVPSSGVW